jgi:hypothetical protein
VLLALTIISTLAAVISALSAFVGVLPRRRTKPQTVVIIVNDVTAPAAEPPKTTPIAHMFSLVRRHSS